MLEFRISGEKDAPQGRFLASLRAPCATGAARRYEKEEKGSCLWRERCGIAGAAETSWRKIRCGSAGTVRRRDLVAI